MEEVPLKQLFSHLKCVACGRSYEVPNIKILEHRDNIWYLDVQCDACGVKGKMAIDIRDSEESKTVCGLPSAERDRIQRAEPITLGDVQAMHNFIQTFNGNFTCLLNCILPLYESKGGEPKKIPQ